MSTIREWIKLISQEWSTRGWADISDSIMTAASSLEGGKSPAVTAKALPKAFYVQNNLKQTEVTSVLNNLSPPLDMSTSHSNVSILLVLAGPSDQERLRLGAETRDIVQALRAAKLRDMVSINSVPAARPTDLSNAFNEYLPNILHISAHGSINSIAFEGNDGNTVSIDTDTLGQIVAVAGKQLRMVVLSACESAQQAQILTSYVDIAIGMNDSISDDAARHFAVQLYSSIATGIPVQQAFDQAVLDIKLRGIKQSDIPQLYSKSKVNADKYYFVKAGAV